MYLRNSINYQTRHDLIPLDLEAIMLYALKYPNHIADHLWLSQFIDHKSNQIKSNNNLFKMHAEIQLIVIPMFLQENHEVDPIRVVPLTYIKSTLKNIYQTSVPKSTCSFNLLLKSEGCIR
jgi:hypothetical protein